MRRLSALRHTIPSREGGQPGRRPLCVRPDRRSRVRRTARRHRNRVMNSRSSHPSRRDGDAIHGTGGVVPPHHNRPQSRVPRRSRCVSPRSPVDARSGASGGAHPGRTNGSPRSPVDASSGASREVHPGRANGSPRSPVDASSGASAGSHWQSGAWYVRRHTGSDPLTHVTQSTHVDDQLSTRAQSTDRGQRLMGLWRRARMARLANPGGRAAGSMCSRALVSAVG